MGITTATGEARRAACCSAGGARPCAGWWLLLLLRPHCVMSVAGCVPMAGCACAQARRAARAANGPTNGEPTPQGHGDTYDSDDSGDSDEGVSFQQADVEAGRPPEAHESSRARAPVSRRTHGAGLSMGQAAAVPRNSSSESKGNAYAVAPPGSPHGSHDSGSGVSWGDRNAGGHASQASGGDGGSSQGGDGTPADDDAHDNDDAHDSGSEGRNGRRGSGEVDGASPRLPGGVNVEMAGDVAGDAATDSVDSTGSARGSPTPHDGAGSSAGDVQPPSAAPSDDGATSSRGATPAEPSIASPAPSAGGDDAASPSQPVP